MSQEVAHTGPGWLSVGLAVAVFSASVRRGRRALPTSPRRGRDRGRTSVGAVSEPRPRGLRRIPIDHTVREVSPGRAGTDRTACLVRCAPDLIVDLEAMPCAAPQSSQTYRGCLVAGRTDPARRDRGGGVAEEGT